ncbi:MAG: LLM class flavin-dependent oxidoreductase [Terrimesophilobacter sp.]
MDHSPALSIHLSNHDSARDIVAAVQLAEKHGIGRVWLSEDLYYRGAMPIAAASLAVTERIGIGFGILAPQHRHPASMAMDVRTLLDLAPSRVAIGLGAGVAERAKLIGMQASPPLRIVSEAVESLRVLLKGDALDQEGALHESAGLRLSGEGPGIVPPIFVAAVGPKALEQAGRSMDGAILTMMCSREHARWAAAQVSAAGASANRSEVPVVAYLPIAVDRDSDAAKDRMRGVLAGFIARWAGVGFLSKLFTDWSELDEQHMARISEAVAEGGDLRELVPNELVDQYCVAGSPDECVRLIEEFGAAGITEIAFDAGDDLVGVLNFIESIRGL